MFNLPYHIQNIIWSYDSTYHDIYKKNVKEIKWISNKYQVYKIITTNSIKKYPPFKWNILEDY
jgi:hypothetical protein